MFEELEPEAEKEVLKALAGIWTFNFKNEHTGADGKNKIAIINGNSITGGDDSFYWFGGLTCYLKKYKNETGKATLTEIIVESLITVKAYNIRYQYNLGEILPLNIFRYDENPFLLICRGEYYPTSKELNMYGIIDTKDDGKDYNAIIKGRFLNKI